MSNSDEQVIAAKALIIDDPWISLILDGSKTWEMRSRGTHHRGWFGLIRKGTGAVWGVARLVESGPRMNVQEMEDTFAHHRIPPELLDDGSVRKWTTPWKLADVRKLTPPVRYRHNPGAVTWVRLDTAATAAIARHLGSIITPELPGSAPRTHSHLLRDRRAPKTGVNSPDSSCQLNVVLGEVEITAANIAYKHFYLRSIFDRFPAEVKGGPNKTTAATQKLTIEWGGPEPVHTDLDSKKKLFRARRWVGEFYEHTGATPGDRVRIEELAPFRYEVKLIRQAYERDNEQGDA